MRRTVNERKGSTSPAAALTPRERQILELVTDGYASREIATQLKISTQTVEVHRFNLMRRLNVRNVAQLIRQALILRYLPHGLHAGGPVKGESMTLGRERGTGQSPFPSRHTAGSTSSSHIFGEGRITA